MAGIVKILLVTPNVDDHAAPWIPLGQCYMAGLAKSRGHEVIMFDRMLEHVRARGNAEVVEEKMIDLVKKYRPDLIGLSTVSSAIFDSIACARSIRKVYSGRMVAGGHHTSVFPNLTLERLPELDAVVAGEGEYALLHLAESADPADPFPGVLWRTESSAGIVQQQRKNDLDSLPFPDLEILDTDYYTAPNTRLIRGFYLSSVCLLTSRGCQNACVFCAESSAYGAGVAFHSPEYVVENMEQVIMDFSINGIYFYDNDFLIDPERVERICEMILHRGIQKKISWCIQARADRIEKDIVKSLKRAGCVKIELGIESTEQRLLNRIDKSIVADQNIQAIRKIQKAGVRVHSYFLNGLEDESIKDYEKQLRAIKKVRPDTFQWGEVVIFPGSRLYRQKGEQFYERNAWTEKNIREFSERRLLSRSKLKIKREWMDRHYRPYYGRRNRWSRLRNNGFNYVAKKVLSKLFALPFARNLERSAVDS